MKDCITQKLFSGLIEYSNTIFSDRFNDLINLGLISSDEGDNFFLISQVTREWLSKVAPLKLVNISTGIQTMFGRQHFPKIMCFDTFLFLIWIQNYLNV